MTDIIDDDYLDARRAYHVRMRRERKLRETINLVANIAILAGAVIGFFLVMVWLRESQPTRERAAYLEGRYNVSHAVAMQMAESEVR